MTARTAARCPSCDGGVGPDDEFCEACGHRLGRAPTAVADDPDRVHSDQGRAAVVSDRGLLHEYNEDAYFLDATADRVVVVVCDGVSSSTAPALAARVGADAAGAALRDGSPDLDAHHAMRTAIRQARAAVAAISWAPVRGHAAPSSTIVAASCAGADVTVGWLGDSRAYWIDADDARRLTDDDSWVEEMVATGELDEAQAALDPRAHVITAWLGADAPIRDARVVSFRAPRRGHLLLCSDGLWNTLAEAAAVGDAIRTAPPTASPLGLARSLTHHALAAGGRDNITIAVVDIDPTAAKPEES